LCSLCTQKCTAESHTTLLLLPRRLRHLKSSTVFVTQTTHCLSIASCNHWQSSICVCRPEDLEQFTRWRHIFCNTQLSVVNSKLTSSDNLIWTSLFSCHSVPWSFLLRPLYMNSAKIIWNWVTSIPFRYKSI